MNFTREPIIETIISAKEGYKLSIKSSKSTGGEDYLVDAVEVVSFGGTFFYRSGERPKAFFLPASDYEILEVRETRLLIKQPSIEKSIKIGGGKKREDDSHRHEAAAPQEGEEAAVSGEEAHKSSEQQQGGKRDRRRNRRGRGRGSEDKQHTAQPQQQQAEMPMEGEQSVAPPPPSAFSHLLQPPEGLISDTLKKYKRSEDLPTAPGIVEELASHIEHSVGEGIMSGHQGPESPATDPELISEPPSKDDFHEPLYSIIDETELPPGIE